MHPNNIPPCLRVSLLIVLAGCGGASSSDKGHAVGGGGLVDGIGSNSPTPTFALVAAPNVIST